MTNTAPHRKAPLSSLSPKLSIQVEKRETGWVARLRDTPSIWEFGHSRVEAIGSLVEAIAEMQPRRGLSIRDVDPVATVTRDV